jgi:phosphate transport system substrate-binding protein
MKRARRRWRLLGWGAMAILLLTPPPASSAAAARTISMSGASPAQALVADLAYFYRHETRNPPRFSLVAGGTGTGIADATRGIVDAGLSGRPLAADDPPGLVFTPLAQSAICLVTNATNKVPNLTRAQIQDLVAGRVTMWSQIPGSTRSDLITPVAFDATSAARSVFTNVFVDIETPVAYAPRTFSASAQVRNFIAATPTAWGYVDQVFARGLNVARYEGVDCTRATVVSGAYPARRTMGALPALDRERRHGASCDLHPLRPGLTRLGWRRWPRRPRSTRSSTSTAATTTWRRRRMTPSGGSRSARSATSRCSAS